MVKILLIDDDQDNLESLQELLQLYDFTVTIVGNGVEGIEMAQQLHPDLIICDINMPKVNGFEVLKKLRQDPTLYFTPFLFLTSLWEKNSLRQGMNLGADDYIIKPISADEIIQTIHQRLEKQARFQATIDQKLDALRANISRSLPHELKTPLQGVIGFADLLIAAHGSLNPSEILEIAESILISGERLERLVQNFLLCAQIQLNQPLGAFSAETLKYCQSLIQQVALDQAKRYDRSLDLVLALEDSSLAIGKEALRKIVEEVVDNGFKFSQPGTPVTLVGTIEDETYVLTLTDRGRGMTAAQISKIDAYMQFDRNIYEQQGLGLGLTIAKKIAEIHQGCLTLTSEVGKQTIVKIVLPV